MLSPSSAETGTLVTSEMAFDSLIPSLLTNKIDIIAAGMSGKIKTVLQMMLVVVLTITGEGLLPALLTIAASVMTLYSMCEYVWQNRSVLGGAK